MNSIEKVEQVLASGVLMTDLLVIPDRGASEAEIRDEQLALGQDFSSDFRRFLARWNGANLDVLVLFGCEGTHAEIPSLRSRQALLPEGLVGHAVVIGSDPAGFLFVEAPGGQILSVDTQGGELEHVAPCFDEFICRYVFGVDADRFAGEDWREELQAAGILS